MFIQDLNPVFYDVDTQNDFMSCTGKLYVPNSEMIRPNLADLTQYSYVKGIKVFGSVDSHSLTDAEIVSQQFSEHCIKGTKGQMKIMETFRPNSAFIPNSDLSLNELENKIRFSDALYFEKQTFDVFNTKYARDLLKHVKQAVVYGVATEYCVKAAVLGMLSLGVKVYLVEDAIMGIGVGSSMLALEEMINNGANIVSTKNVLGGKIK